MSSNILVRSGRQLITILVLLTACNLQAKVINTVFGAVDEAHPAILKLIDSKVMQRLKYIDQSGLEAYFAPNCAKFSRYDHSVGVYALLKKYKASVEEQIAGLLHDASHTAFSHLADVIYQEGQHRKESYQDSIHDWFLKNTGLDRELAYFHLSIEDVSPKNPSFIALEQPYPDMNADRIEYNLHTAVLFGDLNDSEIQQILKSLKFSDGKWYFTDIMAAKKFAKLSTYYTKTFWGSPYNVAMTTVGSALLKHAVQEEIITTDDIHFGVDQEILKKLRAAKSPIIKELLVIITNLDQYYSKADADDYHVFQPIKMRGIDPLVLNNGNLLRLSAVNRYFKNELQATREHCQRGVHIKFVNIKTDVVRDLLLNSNV